MFRNLHVDILEPDAAFDRQALQAQLAGKRGRHFWRALEELADSEAFHQQLRSAFPRLADAAGMDRRGFLKFLGASLALAGLAGCTSPPRGEMVPWVNQPPFVDGDLPQFYATALTTSGYAVGVLVESHLGRPTKIEGNPAHPASLGATDARLQAAVLQVWDPDRSQMPMHAGVAATWGRFEAHALELGQRFGANASRLRVLSGRILSPTLARLREAFLQRFPGAQWHQYEAIDNAQTLAGAELALGQRLVPRYHFENAAMVVALDADFLGTVPAHIRYARDFAARRDPSAAGGMSRLYALEPTPSLTGAMADHAWPLETDAIGRFAQALAQVLDSPTAAPDATLDPLMRQRAQAVAADLRAHAGRSLVLVGEAQPPPIHALAHRLNAQLGNVGQTVDYVQPPQPVPPDAPGSLRALAAAMAADRVDTLIMLDVNPVYDTAADIHFGQRLQRVRDSIHLGLYRNETGHASDWHLPLSHPLEAWSDTTAWDGTHSVVQPLLQPLYDSRSMHQMLAMLNGTAQRDGRDMVQATWRKRGSGDFAARWQTSLQEGVVASEAVALPHSITSPAPAVQSAAAATSANHPSAGVDANALELLFRPDPHVWDGRYANNGWLQELPRPMTQLTWDNAALIAPALALQYGLSNGDIVELVLGEQRVRAPVWLLPGQAPRSVTVHLGYGRTQAGRIGSGVGFNVYPLRDSRTPWARSGLRLEPTGEHVGLAATQHHFTTEASEPVRSITLEAFMARVAAGIDSGLSPPPPSLYPPRAKGEYSWGMAIDLNSCIGCKACTIACQAENNIPIVGADQVRKGREMHWIRVDRYYEGAVAAPVTYHQPVPCMMCEDAPCELVCPVGATLHDSEGLNLQVYNRCVGTRFCSNNCPYKVRRFNFLQYSDLTTESLKGQRNPDVSVRNRGVMEKCTYCIQRIERAHISADKASRSIADGEVVTACQAVCPTRAIIFGDMSDPGSAVSRAKASAREYTMLEELNTRPHTTYAARVSNPNPALHGDAA